jgi:hypothetical protein
VPERTLRSCGVTPGLLQLHPRPVPRRHRGRRCECRHVVCHVLSGDLRPPWTYWRLQPVSMYRGDQRRRLKPGDAMRLMRGRHVHAGGNRWPLHFMPCWDYRRRLQPFHAVCHVRCGHLSARALLWSVLPVHLPLWHRGPRQQPCHAVCQLYRALDGL